MPKINLLKSETLIRISELKADYDKDLLSTLANTSVRDLRNYLSFKLGEISNEAKALQYTIAMVCSAKFIDALQKYAIVQEVEENTFQSFLGEINQLLERRDTGSFDIDRFWNSELVQDYAQRLLALVADQIDEKQHTRIRVYMRDYCPLFFKELLSSETTIYNKLLKFLTSPLHLAQQERYYRDKYYTDLKHEYTSVTLNDPKGMTLDHVYQEPGFSVYNRCLTEEKQKDLKRSRNEKIFISASELQIGDDVHSFTLKWMLHQIDHEHIKSDSARILMLYGYPGQGKSSFCKRLIHDVLEEVPVDEEIYLIRLRNIEEPQMLKSEVLSTVCNYLNNRHKLSLDNDALRSCTLVLDGLDELLMKNELRTNDIDAIMRSLIYEVKLNRNLRMVVTSRHGYLNLQSLRTSELLILSLNEFELELQIKWVDAYQIIHPTAWLNREKIKEIHRSRGYLRELLAQPILLQMIAALDGNITDQVPNRAKVYELLFEQLTNPRKWKERQVDILDGLNADDLRQALREIAFNIFLGGREYIHRKTIEELPEVQRLISKLGGRMGRYQETLKVLMIAFYFQETPRRNDDIADEDNSQYAIEFLHKSLQEYLTAEFIWFHMLDTLLSKNRRGIYVMESVGEILEYLQKVFGHQPLSREIRGYLIQLIKNDTQKQDQMELASRLGDCFEYCLGKHFLDNFQSGRQNRSIQVSMTTFYGYLTVYTHLLEKVELSNFKSKDHIEEFTFLLSVLGRSFLPVKMLRLSSANLSGADLSGTDLSGADLTGVDLSNANLSGAKFSGAKLENANLSGADLSGADLSLADLSGANLRRADLSGADLSLAHLKLADLQGVNLAGAYLNGADLSLTELIRADLRGTDFSSATFQRANLGFADLSRADLTFANLNFADLSGAFLRGASLVGAALVGTTLSGTDLTGADLQNADLTGAEFEQTNLTFALNLKFEQFLVASKVESVRGIGERWLKMHKDKKTEN